MASSKKIVLPLLGLLAVVSILGSALWFVPQWQASRLTTGQSGKPITDSERFEVENKARTTIVQAVGGLFLFMTAFAALRNARAAEENRKIAEETKEINKQVAENNRSLTEDKQVSERFTKAVEMLADEDRLAVRLGGIYSLERIAIDSPKDQWAIAEVLAAYIRANAPIKEPRYGETRYFEDIRAAFSVIGLKQAPDGKYIDLERTDLRGVNLKYAELDGAYLIYANLWGAYLPHTSLTDAKMWNADLTDVNLQNATLRKAHLRDVCFYSSNLANADLTEAILLGASFVNANLRGCSKFLTIEQIKSASVWQEAIYDLDFAKELGLDLDEQIRKAKEWDEERK